MKTTMLKIGAVAIYAAAATGRAACRGTATAASATGRAAGWLETKARTGETRCGLTVLGAQAYLSASEAERRARLAYAAQQRAVRRTQQASEWAARACESEKAAQAADLQWSASHPRPALPDMPNAGTLEPGMV